MAAKRHHVVATAFVFAFLGLQAVALRSATAQEASGASIDKVGWWNASRGPQSGEPDNPVRPALAPVPAPPTNVPSDAVGVAASAGEPSKVAAVGILLDAAPGATADALTLSVKEAPAPGANVASDQARIVACPITGFWGETRNGNWVDRPTADCTQASAEGKRAADGTWTFDLASMASMWLSSDGPGQNGVLLVEAVDAPSGFETSFLDPAAGGMALQYSASGGGAAENDPYAIGDTSSGSDSFAVPSGDVALGSIGGSTEPFTLSPSPTPSAGAAAPSPAATGSGHRVTGANNATPAAARSGGRAGHLVGNLSLATLLLIPAALVLALVLSLSLGDTAPTAAADDTAAPVPAPGRRRLGGVSRALARRERAEPLAPNA